MKFKLSIYLSTLLLLLISCEKNNEDLINAEAKEIQSTANLSLRAEAINNSAAYTQMNSFWMREDHEPWNRGRAEIYAFVFGLDEDNNRNPIVTKVNLAFADHDKTMYYQKIKLIDWNAHNYAEGKAVILFMEADERIHLATGGESNYVENLHRDGRYLEMPVCRALGFIADNFRERKYLPPGGPHIDSTDDYVDIFFCLSRDSDYELIDGFFDNVHISLERKFDN